MRFVRRVSVVFSVVLFLGGLAVAIAHPGPQHMICPSCYGLRWITPGVYVERTFTRAQRERISQDLDRARQRVSAFFGPLKSKPRIVVCQTKACAGVFGSQGAKGVAYGWFAILLSPSRIFVVIAAHELVHIELHWRMGLSGWARGTVPVWFDEGLATVLSGDPRYRKDATHNAVREVMQVRSFLANGRTTHVVSAGEQHMVQPRRACASWSAELGVKVFKHSLPDWYATVDWTACSGTDRDQFQFADDEIKRRGCYNRALPSIYFSVPAIR